MTDSGMKSLQFNRISFIQSIGQKWLVLFVCLHEFGYEDIVKGSGYISCQCCGNTEIELGTVYAAEMGITLFSQIDRYTLEDAKVELFYHFKLADGSYEKIPMGVFEAIEANRLA